MAADLTTPEHWETAINRAASRMFVLAAIAEGPGHGYALARRVRDMCDGCCDPSAGVMYPAIRDLESEGLIACAREAVGGRERNVCTLTAKGEAALRTAAQAWARHLPAIRRVVESAGTGVGSGEAAGLCCNPELEMAR
jgi:PadR family transcriptional regulator PadR